MGEREKRKGDKFRGNKRLQGGSGQTRETIEREEEHN